MFTPTQVSILKFFCSSLTERYSINGLTAKLKKKYKVVYLAAQELIKEGFLLKDEHLLLSLNKNRHWQELAYIESLRAGQFLKKHKSIALFTEDIVKKFPLCFFTLLLFGSYASGQQTKKSDIDILMIVEHSEDTEKLENYFQTLSERYGNFHCQVIGKDSAQEMLRSFKLDVINETFNKHILFFGAEAYYRLINQDGS